MVPRACPWGSIFLIFSSFVFRPLSVVTLFAAEAQKAMVATADPRATEAALAILQKGGNAVDAAIAAQWVLNVVEPQSSGLGGGGFFLYYDALSKQVYAFDGRETAPAEASPDMFLDEKGEPYPFHPDRITGGLPVGVPGTLKLLKAVHDQFGSGKIKFAQLFNPAIRLAENGFPVSKRLAHFTEREKSRLALFPSSREIFLDPRGLPLSEGHPLIQQDLAGTFRLIQEKGVGVFYKGEIARDIVRAVRTAPFHPGRMAAPDLKNYTVKERGAVRGTYRGYEIYSMGPPSSGGTTLLEALNMLELYDLALYGKSAKGLHLFSRIQGLAFEDRNRYLGDPDVVQVPVGKLISKEYARERVQEMKGPGPTWGQAPSEGTHTTHLSIVDEFGNMVSYTTTIEDIFGSAMVVPGRGFFLNNELTDFEALPQSLSSPQVLGGDPKAGFPTKAFGNDSVKSDESVSHPNAPGPGKRPRSSMTPVFIFKEGKPVLIVGSPGGTTIIGTVLNITVNVIDFGMNLLEAVALPRVINREGVTEIETALYQDARLRQELQKYSLGLKEIEPFGNAQAIYFDQARGLRVGESDPRGEGKAEGY